MSCWLNHCLLVLLFCVLHNGGVLADEPNYCPCNPYQIWNDVVLLMDASNDLPANKYGEITQFYQEHVFATLPLGQGTLQTRLGVILYGSDIKRVANLTTYTNFEDFFVAQLNQMNTEGTNILAAIDDAMDLFANKTEHRSNARKVILIVASTYRSGSYDSPSIAATTFKANGGIIFVIEYGDTHGGTSEQLEQLASTGYYINAVQNPPDIQTIFDRFCSANCFCKNGYKSPVNSAMQEPKEGCFFISDLPSNPILGKHLCAKTNNGTLAMPRTTAQQQFLQSNMKSDTGFVGLERADGVWTWADGTPYVGNLSGPGNCSVLHKSGDLFTSYDCSAAQIYICESVPCSSFTYCVRYSLPFQMRARVYLNKEEARFLSHQTMYNKNSSGEVKKILLIYSSRQ